MKQHSIIGVLVGLLALLPLLTSAQSSAQRLQWHYGSPQLQLVEGATKSLEMSLTIAPDESFQSNHWIEITPTLRAKEGRESITFPSIYVAGAKRYLQMRRNETLGNALPEGLTLSAVRCVDELASKPLRWHQSIAFEPWMAQAELVMEEKVYGCATCDVRQGRGVVAASDISLFGPAQFRYSYLEPVAVARKSYEESFVSRVTFMVARHEVVPSFGNNQSELRRIKDFIEKALKLSEIGATVGEVAVTGYASPEGRFESNLALSERRSQSLATYVKSQYPQLAKGARFNVIGGGEDWTGLRKAVAESDKSYASDVVSIIDRYTTDVDREKDIKALEQGKVYTELLNNFYPPLRRTVFRMQYDVRPYTVEELPMVFDRNVALMSHHELYTLAKHFYQEQGKSPVAVYKVAFDRFGEKDEVARLNYANALLQYEPNRAEEIIGLVAPLGNDKRAIFLKACAYQLLGDQVRAEQLYEESK